MCEISNLPIRPHFFLYVQQDRHCYVLSLLYVYNVCLVCVGVFVHVCIWFTHQASGVVSLTWWRARHGEATCLTCFRSLLGSDVSWCEGLGNQAWGSLGGGATVWEAGSEGDAWVHEWAILERERESLCVRAGVLGAQIFKVLMTCCKWPMIQNRETAGSHMTHALHCHVLVSCLESALCP